MTLSLAAAPKIPQKVTGTITNYNPPSASAVSFPKYRAPTSYGSLLSGDPLLQQSLANINAQGLTERAQLGGSLTRSLANYGQVPAGLPAELQGLLDPATAQLARTATDTGVSTLAQLAKAYQQRQQADTASLAARGLLRSGAYGQHQNEDLSNYTISRYQAGQQLQDYLNGLYQGYLNQQQTLRQQGISAQSDALNRLIAQINAGQVSPYAPASTVMAATGPQNKTGLTASAARGVLTIH